MARLNIPAADAPNRMTIVVDVVDGAIVSLRVAHAAPVGTFEYAHVQRDPQGNPILMGSPPAPVVDTLPNSAQNFVDWCERKIVDRLVATGKATELP